MLADFIVNTVVSARVNDSVIPCQLEEPRKGTVVNRRELRFSVDAQAVVAQVELLDWQEKIVHVLPVPAEKFTRRGKYVVRPGDLLIRIKEESA